MSAKLPLVSLLGLGRFGVGIMAGEEESCRAGGKVVLEGGCIGMPFTALWEAQVGLQLTIREDPPWTGMPGDCPATAVGKACMVTAIGQICTDPGMV